MPSSASSTLACMLAPGPTQRRRCRPHHCPCRGSWAVERQPHGPVGQGACMSLSASWHLHPADATSAPIGSVIRRSHVSSLRGARGAVQRRRAWAGAGVGGQSGTATIDVVPSASCSRERSRQASRHPQQPWQQLPPTPIAGTPTTCPPRSPRPRGRWQTGWAAGCRRRRRARRSRRRCCRPARGTAAPASSAWPTRPGGTGTTPPPPPPAPGAPRSATARGWWREGPPAAAGC